MSPQSRIHSPKRSGPAFTLVEILLAITIFSMVCLSISATWSAILRSTKAGLAASEVAQRYRAVGRIIEEALGSAQSYSANLRYYSFVAPDSGSVGALSFVSRLADSFPRSGKFGDLNLRRVEFVVEPDPEGGRQLVLRQCPLLMDFDEDERLHPLVLAKHVEEFKAEFWEQRKAEWVDEWTETNSMPPLVRVTLALANNNRRSFRKSDEIVRIVSLPATAVPAMWQRPVNAPAPPPNPTPGNPNTPGRGSAPPGTPQPVNPGRPNPGGQNGFPGLVPR